MKFYTSVSRNGSFVLHRGYENGKQFKETIKYKPYLFTTTKEKEINTKYSTLNGEPVIKVDFDNIWEQKKWYDQWKEVHGFSIYGTINPISTFIYDNYHGEVKFDSSLIKIAIIDIECADLINSEDFIEVAPSVITTISLRVGDKKFAFGCKDFVAPKGVKYFKCKDERVLLNSFLKLWEGIGPDIVSGWNIVGFDLPYLINRVKRICSEDAANKLSPFNKIVSREFRDKFNIKKTYDIVGVQILDYMELYKKFTLQIHGNLESYSLNFVSYFELEENKIDYSEFGSLPELYEKNFQKYLEYNIHDTDLVKKLDDKLKFFDLVFEIAYMAKCNFQDVLKSIPVWDSLIHAYLMDRRIVVPQSKRSQVSQSIPGGYVKEPIPGMYNWVVSFDISSLYPNLIRSFNLSPETLEGKISIPSIDAIVQGEKIEHGEYCVAASGCLYSKTKKGFMPVLMGDMFDLRNQYKNEMLEVQKNLEFDRSDENVKKAASLKAKQQAIKILMNSLYGSMCNEYFRFFSVDLAMSITLSGQLTIKWLEKHFNDYMKLQLKDDKNRVLAVDTDSNFLDCSDLIKKYLPDEKNENKIVDALDKFGEGRAQLVIKNALDKLSKTMNMFDNTLKMSRDCIARKVIWTGKKRYVMNILDKEGVRLREAKMKFTGIETVRSSVPEVCREGLKEALSIIMNKDEEELIQFVEEFKRKFNSLSFYEVASPRGVNGLDSYYDSVTLFKKACPIHVRGSLIYNDYIKRNNLDKKYVLINNGDKIKFCYLKLPNKLRSDVVSCLSKIPDEMNISEMIDYEKQFNKTFEEPLNSILNAINWNLKKEYTLEGMFA